MPISNTPFLEKLDEGKKTGCGIYLFETFVSKRKAKDTFDKFNSLEFPWDVDESQLLQSNLSREHAFVYDRSKFAKQPGSLPHGLVPLEKLVEDVEFEFHSKIDTVYCNRFQDPSFSIDWHKMSYTKHIAVMVLGAANQAEEFRPKNRPPPTTPPSSTSEKTLTTTTDGVETVNLRPGCIYFMPITTLKYYERRIKPVSNNRGVPVPPPPVVASPASQNSTGSGDDKEIENTTTRIVLTFLMDTPAYAKEFKLSMGDRLRGLKNSIASKVTSPTLTPKSIRSSFDNNAPYLPPSNPVNGGGSSKNLGFVKSLSFKNK